MLHIIMHVFFIKYYSTDADRFDRDFPDFLNNKEDSESRDNKDGEVIALVSLSASTKSSRMPQLKGHDVKDMYADSGERILESGIQMLTRGGRCLRRI